MNIVLNGKQIEVKSNSTITQMLDQLGLSGKPVVIEYNKIAIFPRDYPLTNLEDSDELEIINIAAGG